MAEKLTAVPYIGEKTVKEVKRGLSRNKRVNLTPQKAATLGTDYLKVMLSKRQRRELAKYVGRPENSLLTREEKTEIARKEQSGQRERGERKGVGDFIVERSEQKKAFEQHQERSERARDVDNQRRATLTTNFGLWSSEPDDFDFPGVDTPNRKPRKQERDTPFIAAEDFRRDIDEDERDEFGSGIPGL